MQVRTAIAPGERSNRRRSLCSDAAAEGVRKWRVQTVKRRAHSARVHHLLGSGGLGRAEVCSIHDSLAVIGVRRAWVARMRRMPFLRMSRRQGGGG